MNISEAMREVESHQFAARLNLASDLKTFLRAAKMEEGVTTLLEEMTSPDKRAGVLSRIVRISQNRVDRRYENPWDVSLAVYFWILTFTDLEFAKVAAQSIEHTGNCWWARQIADQLLSAGHIHTTAGVHEVSRHFLTTPSSASLWESIINSIKEGVILIGEPVASATVIRAIGENSTAGEMMTSSGLQGIDTMVSASVNTVSHGSYNYELGWLGHVRPPYTTGTSPDTTASSIAYAA